MTETEPHCILRWRFVLEGEESGKYVIAQETDEVTYGVGDIVVGYEQDEAIDTVVYGGTDRTYNTKTEKLPEFCLPVGMAGYDFLYLTYHPRSERL